MKTRHIIIAVAAVVIVAMAWNTSREYAPTTEVQADRLYPELVDDFE